jgi:predicted RNA-binding Zn ribbon-like protein
MRERMTPETIRLVGGSLCTDFANTVDYSTEGEHVAPETTDVLTEPDLLLRWGRRMGLYPQDPHPPVDDGELARVRALRDAAYACLAAIACDRTPDQRDINLLATEHAEAVDQGHLQPTGAAWQVTWPPGDPRRVRYAVTIDILDLLTHEHSLRRLRCCPGRNCGWLFLDASGRRRWCSMQTCGSRDKMRRRYHRQRQQN